MYNTTATAHAVQVDQMCRELDSAYGEKMPLTPQVPKSLVSEHMKPCLLRVCVWLQYLSPKKLKEYLIREDSHLAHRA